MSERKKLEEEREAHEEELRKKQAQEKDAATKGGENDPDANDDVEAAARRNNLIVVNPKDERARKARLVALQRWRREIVGDDTVKGKEKEDKMIMEKLHRVLDMKLVGVDEEFERKKKPIDRQIEVLSLERDHASSQGISTGAIDEKIENLQHRISIMEKQRQLNKQPIMEKKDMVALKYVHIGQEHEAERDYHSCKLKQQIVGHKDSKIAYQVCAEFYFLLSFSLSKNTIPLHQPPQTDIKASTLRHQKQQLERSLNELLSGSPDWERVSHQIGALDSKIKKLTNQCTKERTKYSKLSAALGKELDKLGIAREKAERARQRADEEKQKQEQGFSSDEDSDSDGAFSFFRRRTPEEIRRREKKRQEKREKVAEQYKVI